MSFVLKILTNIRTSTRSTNTRTTGRTRRERNPNTPTAPATTRMLPIRNTKTRKR